MNRIGDPYTAEAPLLECVDCGARPSADADADDAVGTCPECGGTVTNIAVPRE